jgi:hypothetical protein
LTTSFACAKLVENRNRVSEMRRAEDNRFVIESDAGDAEGRAAGMRAA